MVNYLFDEIRTYSGDIIEKSAEILKTQPEHLVNTTKRFINEIKESSVKSSADRINKKV